MQADATRPEVTAFFHSASKTISYVVADPETARCAIIDPVLDFDAKSGRTGTETADRLLAFVAGRGYRLDWILETHAHADHLSAGSYVKNRQGGQIAIGAEIGLTQRHFGHLFNFSDMTEANGAPFDRLFQDGDAFAIGGLAGVILHTPGHTPACVTYVIGDAAFVGDTLFMPDYGTARCDFPGGDARQLYRSIRRILDLPPATRLFTCHDYQPGGRDPAWETTVAEQRARNIHIHDGVSEEDFVTMREARDRTLSVPDLLLPAIQVNIRAGLLPTPEVNGRRYLKLPLDSL
jgi:glyoxylase-like metal-dependent hydrolase (beta-lactamase superfamily II)